MKIWETLIGLLIITAASWGLISFVFSITKVVKKLVTKSSNPSPAPSKEGQYGRAFVYIDGKPIGFCAPMTFTKDCDLATISFDPCKTLEHQLQEAVDNEQYELAAKIRDKMIKTNEIS